MKTGILINARLSSKRLPRKHAIKVKSLNLTFIEILVKRLLFHFKDEIKNNELIIIINSSCRKINYDFDEIFDNYNDIEVYHGNDENIPYRQLRCSEQFNLENIISICGDNILISMSAVRNVYNKLKFGSSVTKTVGLPIGLNVAGYSYSHLKTCLKNIPEHSTLDTGWYSIFDKMDEIIMGEYTLHDDFRFTMDYKEDSIFLTKVIEYFGNNIFSVIDKDIFTVVINNEYYKINSHLKEIYWKNFNKKK